VPVADPILQRERKQARRQLSVQELPTPTNVPVGCAFQTRCVHAMEVCRRHRPHHVAVAGGGTVACHLYVEETNGK
jgi:oligopeptide/dipeptide ABC transporter ATP-binding protein